MDMVVLFNYLPACGKRLIHILSLALQLLTVPFREMAVGNTFGATALSSYGGFWISFGIALTPGGFQIIQQYETAGQSFDYAFGFYLFGWFIFTFILLICTLRSTITSPDTRRLATNDR